MSLEAVLSQSTFLKDWRVSPGGSLSQRVSLSWQVSPGGSLLAGLPWRVSPGGSLRVYVVIMLLQTSPFLIVTF